MSKADLIFAVWTVALLFSAGVEVRRLNPFRRT